MTTAPAATATDGHVLPFTPWSRFFHWWQWQQGEHVTVIGPTGTGKTTLIRAALHKRYALNGAVAVLATKSQDDALEQWARADHLTVVENWPPTWPLHKWRNRPRDIVTPSGARMPWQNRVMVWPRPEGMALSQIGDHTADIHRRAMTDMFWSGSWCVVGEELWELSRLGLKPELSQIWTQGRSAGLSLIGATQRPVEIPLFAYSQASHLFLFRDNDERNLERLHGIGGMSGKLLRESVATLDGHDVLYVGVRNKQLVRTRVPFRK